MRLNLTTTRKTLLAALVPFTALSAAGFAYLDLKQREIIFRPDRENDNTAADRGEFDYQEIWIPVGPHAHTRKSLIHAWWVPAERPEAPAILLLHGARWNLAGNKYRVARWHRMGFSVLAIDYRGFGRSPGGLPTEASVYEDAQTAWEYLSYLQPDPGRRFGYGHSLGGAIGIELATRNRDMAGLIVESTFTSIRDMARIVTFPWLPVSPILTQHFNSIAKVAALKTPILLLHGTDDDLVPHRMSERLYAAAPGPKKLVLFPNGGHSDICLKAFDVYRTTVWQFVGPMVEQQAFTIAEQHALAA
jgi:uncharacterized protein